MSLSIRLVSAFPLVLGCDAMSLASPDAGIYGPAASAGVIHITTRSAR